MILKEATIKYKGYDPEDLSKGSHKRVCRSCDNCGRIDWVDNSTQHFSTCRFCSHANENNAMYGVSRYGKTSPHYKNGMSLINMKSWVIDYKGRKCERCGLISNINRYTNFITSIQMKNFLTYQVLKNILKNIILIGIF